MCHAMFSLMDLVGRGEKKSDAVTPDRSPAAHPFAYARMKVGNISFLGSDVILLLPVLDLS